MAFVGEQLISGLFQIVIGIAGAFTPLLVEYVRNQRKKREKPEGKPGETQPAPDRSLLDLAILLVYGAFLSAILAHSMIISGRTPNFSGWVLGAVALIAGSVSAVLHFAWRKGIGEAAAGAISFAALLILVIAPGNMARPGDDPGVEAGLPLPLPVFALTFATAAAVIYLFGNPLAGDTTPARQRRVALGLVLLAGGTSLILGYDFVASTVHDEKAPKFSGTADEEKAANDVLAEVRALDLGKRGIFYRLASESVLAPEYRRAYYAIRPDIEAWEKEQQQLAADAVALAAAEERRVQQEQAAAELSQIETSMATTTTDTAYTPPPTPASQRSYSDLHQDKEALLKAARQKYLGVISRYIDQLDRRGLTEHMQNRMAFIHPISVPPAFEQVLLPMPGLDAASRYAQIADYRLYRMLRNERELPWELETFAYPQSIRGYLEKPTSSYPPPEASQKAREEMGKISDEIFPGGNVAYDRRFTLQMTLPKAEEGALTYRTAMALSATDRPPAFLDLLRKFGALTIEERRSFSEYAAKPSQAPAWLLVKRLADAKADLSGFPEGAPARLDLATRLEQNRGAPCSAELGAAQKACQEIVRALPPSERKAFAKLVQESDRDGATVAPLFSPAVLELVRATDNVGDPRELLDVLYDPLTTAMARIVDSEKEHAGWLPGTFTKFTGLTAENREQLLRHVAIMIYRSTGEFSLSPIRLLALQANSLSVTLALVCATLIMLPGSIIAIALGGFSARKLIERDRTRLLVAAERKTGQVVGDIGLPVALLGRESLLDRIRKLGGRGWNTIALVGRRGIGKSRVLHELYKPSDPGTTQAAVSVWIAAPTNYNEGEFVESVFEQLALRTERAVADQLGARPLPVRLLEKRQATTGTWMFGAALTGLGLLLAVAYNRLSRPEVMITWMPVLIVAAIATAALIRYLAGVQPVDLSPWLERDRSRSASTVLLYREARAALRYLQSRRSRDVGTPPSGGLSSITIGIFVGIVAWITLAIVLESWWMSLLGAIATAWAVVYIINRLRVPLPRGEHDGSSIMSLTANYRRFAATVVHHVQSGAVGEQANVMICIDELDKVIEDTSVRDFLRKMKGIFEVPGVYYYISLAEDTLARLYLAGAEGKNEIDSSLDHIVRVPPLTWDDSMALVRSYARKLGFTDIDSKLAAAITVVSFGIPRDLIRRCDELVSVYVGKPSGVAVLNDPAMIPAEVRRDRIDLACEREGWTRDVHARLSAKSPAASKAIVDLLRAETQDRRQRVLALLWTLCACERACALSGAHGSKMLARLYQLGYDLPIAPVSDLIALIDELGAILDAPPPAELAAVPPAPPPEQPRVPRNGLANARAVFRRRSADGM